MDLKGVRKGTRQRRRVRRRVEPRKTRTWRERNIENENTDSGLRQKVGSGGKTHQGDV